LGIASMILAISKKSVDKKNNRPHSLIEILFFMWIFLNLLIINKNKECDISFPKYIDKNIAGISNNP
jgi:hypothetical protein